MVTLIEKKHLLQTFLLAFKHTAEGGFLSENIDMQYARVPFLEGTSEKVFLARNLQRIYGAILAQFNIIA